jgi:hypothetical protein
MCLSDPLQSEQPLQLKLSSKRPRCSVLQTSRSPVGEQCLLLPWSISALQEIRRSMIRYQSGRIPIQGAVALSASLLSISRHDLFTIILSQSNQSVPHRSFPFALLSSHSGHSFLICISISIRTHCYIPYRRFNGQRSVFVQYRAQ